MDQEGNKTADVVLIASVGRTQEPLEASLAEHTPHAAILIASEDTMGTAAQLRESYPEVSFKTLLLNDPENLTESFRLARKALAMAKKLEAKAIVADITGGTKPMTAGLVLALSGLGVVFSYVGGIQRDPDTGRVLSGSERARVLEDPTVRFHEAEWKAFRQSWNAWRMDAAAEVLGRLLENNPALSPSEQKFFRHLQGVSLGMAAWDRFHHAEALMGIEGNLPVALAIAEAWRHGNKVRVLKTIEAELPRLKRLVKKEGRPTMELLADLLANADRRAEAGHYDDAIARLYRALELAAEADLHHRTGILLRKPETWPDGLQPLMQSRTQRLLGLQSVLDLIFDIDVQLGNQGTLAQKLRAQKLQMGDVLRKRNESILAHGTKPVDHNSHLSFRQVFTGLNLEAAPAWPKW